MGRLRKSGNVRRTRVCAEGYCYLAATVFLFAGALIRNINLLLLLAGMMLGAFVVNWFWARAAVKRIKVKRRPCRHVQAGDPLTVEIEAQNRGLFSTWGLAVEDQVYSLAADSSDPPIRPAALVPRLARRGVAPVVYRLRLMRRGRYRFGPLRWSSRFPFGLVRATCEAAETETIVVLPRIGQLTSRWSTHDRSGEAARANRASRQGDSEGDFHSLRDWRPGDGSRRIHWRTSARLRELMVRQFEQPRSQDLVLLVDLWRPEQPDPRHEESVELAVSFAATILATIGRRGGGSLSIGVVGRERVWLRGSASIRLAEQALEKLALVEADSRDQLAELLDSGFEVLRPGQRTVLISTRPNDPARLDKLLAASREPRKRRALERIERFNAGSEELADFFRVEAPAGT